MENEENLQNWSDWAENLCMCNFLWWVVWKWSQNRQGYKKFWKKSPISIRVFDQEN